MLGVIVQPGGMVGRPGRMEQAVIAAAIQSPRMRRYPERVEGRMCFIPFLYWQKTGESSRGKFGFHVIYYGVSLDH